MSAINADVVWVPVLPDMSSFGRTVSREVGGLQAAANRAGRGMGQAYSQGASSGLQQLQSDASKAGRAQETAAAKVVRAQKTVETATKRQADAAGRLRVAEARLEEVRTSGKAKASQLAAAEEAVARAKRSVDAESGKAEDATRGLTDAQEDARRKTDQAEAATKRLGDAQDKAGVDANGLAREIDDVGDAADRADRKTSRLAAGLGKTLKWGAVAAGGAVVGLAAVAAKSGLDRLMGIEDARASLSGLGHDARAVDAIMDNALASVKGTAFGLADAGKVAASAVAAGIRPGRDLESNLKLVADAATIAGTDMGSMGAIFNKVAASNKIQGDTIAQLNDAGIPVVKLMAKELGVTAEETVKLASAGKVDFATFSTAMQKGLGGAALKSGETLRGSLANTRASLGRIGANFLSGVYPKLAPAFQNLTGLMEPLETKAAGFGEGLGRVASVVSSRLAPVLAPIGGFLRDTIAPAFSEVTSRGGQVGKTISAVGGFVASLLPTVRTLGSQFAEKIGPALKSLGGLIVNDFLPAFRGILPIIQPIAAFLIRTLGSALIGLFQGVVRAIKGVVQIITGVFRVLKGVVTGDWSLMWQGVKDIFFGAIDTVLGAVQAWFNFGILAVFRQGFKALLKLVAKPLTALRTLWGKATGLITRSTSALGKKVLPAFKAIGSFLTKVFLGAVRVVGRVASAVFRGIAVVARWLWAKAIKPVFAAWKMYFERVLFPVVRFLWGKVVRPIFGLIGRGIRAVWGNTVRPVFAAWKSFFDRVLFPVIRFLWNRVVRPVFSGVAGTIRNVWNNGIKPVLSALGNFINQQVRPKFKAGVEALKRIWNGIKEAFKAPIRFVIETVINRGLIGTFNKLVVDKLKLPKLELGTVGLPKGFATGGVLPGYSPGRDVHHFSSPTGGRLHLSGGEAIMRPEWTRQVGGPREVARQNKLARQGRLHGPLSERDAGRRFFLGGTLPLPGANSISQHSGYPWARWAGDLNAPNDLGKPVVSWKPGTVASVISRPDSYGNHVRVNHAGQSSLYAHLSAFAAQVGQAVTAGQMLGRVGSTGNSTGPHLHFEVKGGSVPQGSAFAGAMAAGAAPVMPGWASRILAGPVDWLKGKVSGALEGLTSRFGGGPLVQMLKDLPGRIMASLGSKITSAITGKFAGATSGNVVSLGGLTGPVKDQVRQVAQQFGWGEAPQWPAIVDLVQRESSWNPAAANPTSSARGLFQKMTSIHGPVEATPGGQAAWGLNYIKNRYGTPTAAIAHHNAKNWYAKGGVLPDKMSVFDRGGWLKPGHAAVNHSKRPEPVFSDSQWSTLQALTSSTSALGAGRGGGVMRLRGTLDTPFGPAEVHAVAEGVARDVYAMESSADRDYASFG